MLPYDPMHTRECYHSSLRKPRVTPAPLAEPEEEVRCEIEISRPLVPRYRSHGTRHASCVTYGKASSQAL